MNYGSLILVFLILNVFGFFMIYGYYKLAIKQIDIQCAYLSAEYGDGELAKKIIKKYRRNLPRTET